MTVPSEHIHDLGPQDRSTSTTPAPPDRHRGLPENPTPVDGPDGQQFDISAMGGMALASDETRALIYLTRDLDAFEKASDNMVGGNVDVSEYVNDPTVKRVRTHVELGTVAGTGAYCSAGNYIFDRAAMNLGGVRVSPLISGATDANWTTDFVTTTGIVASGTQSTVGGTLDIFVTATNFPTGTRRFAFRLRRSGLSTSVGGDTTWSDWVDFSAIGQRMDRNGTLLTGSGGLISNTQVLASQVVEDLLGRLLTFCDPGTAQVDATTFGITQLAWPDGVKAADVLTKLAVFESGYLWEILESSTTASTGSTTAPGPPPRAMKSASKTAGDRPGSDVDLCNRILVTWTDATGATQVTPVTATRADRHRPDRSTLPRHAIKDADPISLPDGFGSTANATRIGGQILTDKIQPPRPGRSSCVARSSTSSPATW
jgi:hypothetical protein